jgi:hypothetical protein
MTVPKRNTTFDIQIMRGGRWATESRLNDEEQAKALAVATVADPKCEGARVLRCWLRADGTEMEKEIFCKTQQVREDGIARIDHIDAVPDGCETLADYFRLGSRLVMGRLFHSYLDKVVLTPTEMLHSTRDLKRLRDKDALLPTAVDRVASLQTRQDGQDTKARKDEIFKIVEQIIAKARQTDAVKLPKADKTIADLVKDLPPTTDQWERDYLVLTALTRNLQDIRSFSGKLERLCKLASGVDDPAPAALMDGFVAELLETTAVKDVLGSQPGLGHAICGMLDLADGIMATDRSDAAEAARLLNALFAERRLPESRSGLIDRAHRQIASTSPLYRSDNQREFDTFKKVLLRVLTPAGLHSGTTTALAVTSRYLHMVKECNRKDAVGGVFRAMPDRAYGIIYLCDLAHSEFAQESADKMAETFFGTITGQHITNLVQRSLSPKDRMVRATAAHHAVTASPFPPEIKRPVIEYIDQLLDNYLVEERIVEKLDHPDASLRDRALRLVQFCASGVLPEGKALTRARQRIVAILHQPSFDAHFIDGISDPVKAQKALRDFHQLLVDKAGFSG